MEGRPFPLRGGGCQGIEMRLCRWRQWAYVHVRMHIGDDCDHNAPRPPPIVQAYGRRRRLCAPPGNCGMSAENSTWPLGASRVRSLL